MVLAAVAADRRVNRARARLGPSVDQSEVLAANFAAGHRLLKCPMGRVVWRPPSAQRCCGPGGGRSRGAPDHLLRQLSPREPGRASRTRGPSTDGSLFRRACRPPGGDRPRRRPRAGPAPFAGDRRLRPLGFGDFDLYFLALLNPVALGGPSPIDGHLPRVDRRCARLREPSVLARKTSSRSPGLRAADHDPHRRPRARSPRIPLGEDNHHDHPDRIAASAS